MTTQTETKSFEAEVQQVLSLVVHSLYSQPEIFLRELISNASDALDKLRFESLTQSDLMSEGESLGIVLDVDADNKTLTVADNGIGMDREELMENLGRIASSGTRRFLEATQDGKAEATPDLIGQFGVGFYSAFMVADEVNVVSRKAGTEEGWRWSSTGLGEYSIEPAQGAARGTVIQLRLKDVAEGGKDFCQEWTLREIVKSYSDFVEYPIQMEVERTQPKKDEEGEDIEGETETVVETQTLNSMQPLWSRPKEEIEPEEYKDFYQHLTHDWNEPLRTIHFRAEGSHEYTALLYLPKERPMDLFEAESKASRVSLYVRRVLIMRECEELLPPWLRFMRGVVESADLPLNVSRELVQDNPKVGRIRKRLVKKVLDTLDGMLSSERGEYEGFWVAFGALIKEGIYFGDDDEARVSKLCLFQTSRSDGWTTLAEYVERMGKDQDTIHVICGPDRKTLEASPHLEALKARGEEVLLLTDPVDEWMLQRLTEFDGKPLRAVDRGATQEADEDKAEREAKQEESKDLLEALHEALDEHVSEVRFTGRLKDSVAVLVGEEHGMSAHLERMLRSNGREVPVTKRALEINPEHSLVAGLRSLHATDPKSPRLAEFAELLHGQALIAEGSPVVDASRFASLVTQLMVGSVEP
ncbi:molecular chaperone HtpG [Candidatus Woesearchaeota archaeon]|jgi:molecular chaperone HtpG|nr:molecular chaperone HtpG [Candidatus Woesearchaeota archaeon]MDP6938330.1 molecular chaperone HtpG [Planctomycetota bacterium]